MKTRMLSLITILLFSITSVSAQNEKKETFEVAGNCGMCKTRIEKAATSLDGVTSAGWDRETKLLEVKYDSASVNLHEIHMAVARAGHDTKMHKADKKTYDNLPGCCKYERLIDKGDTKKK